MAKCKETFKSNEKITFLNNTIDNLEYENVEILMTLYNFINDALCKFTIKK